MVEMTEIYNGNNWFETEKYLQQLDKVIESNDIIKKISGCSILITGVTGTIGSYLADLLIRANVTIGLNNSIFLCGRDENKIKSRFAQWLKNKGLRVEVVIYNLEQPVELKEKIDYVFHFAGMAYPKAFSENPVETVEGIINGTSNILKFSKNYCSKRLVYISSAEVYGECDGKRYKYEEDAGYLDSLSPRSCYPLAKRLAENLCIDYISEYKLDVVIARPCHTFGPEWSALDNRAHVQFAKNALNKEDIILNSDGKKKRSYIYVSDCCMGLIYIAVNGVNGRAYNIATEEVLTIRKLAEIFAGCAKTKVIIKNEGCSKLDSPIKSQELNNEALKKIGWKSQYSIEVGVSEIMDIKSKIDVC